MPTSLGWVSATITQICFSWEDYHLHQCGLGGGDYGDDTADESMPLVRFGVRAGSSFHPVLDWCTSRLPALGKTLLGLSVF